MKISYRVLWALSLVFLAAVSCKDDDDASKPSQPDAAAELATLKSDIRENYANIVYNNYLDSYNAAQEMKTAIEAFLAEPTSANKFRDAKLAWKEAREPYGQTEAFRFANGPIDAEDGPEGALNAWPLDESYIDYVDGDADAGIVNALDSIPTITKQLLQDMNERGGEKNISTGYHAIEFLLWGQDLTTPSEKEAGHRPNTDFVDDGTAKNQDRRRTYLKVVTELLLEDLKSMVDAWAPDQKDNYRSTFLAMDVDKALRNVLAGITELGASELAGERMFTALDNRDQEDEHSCFSDNTHRDTRLNALGVKNVYMGSYTRTDGTVISGKSIADWIASEDKTLADQTLQQLNFSLLKVEATVIPFDEAISNDTYRPGVQKAVDELRKLGDKLTEVGAKLGIPVNG